MMPPFPETGVMEVCGGRSCCDVAAPATAVAGVVFLEQFDAKETVTPEVELRIDFSTFKFLGCKVEVDDGAAAVGGFSNGVAIIVNPCFNLSKIEIPWPSAIFVFISYLFQNHSLSFR